MGSSVFSSKKRFTIFGNTTLHGGVDDA